MRDQFNKAETDQKMLSPNSTNFLLNFLFVPFFPFLGYGSVFLAFYIIINSIIISATFWKFPALKFKNGITIKNWVHFLEVVKAKGSIHQFRQIFYADFLRWFFTQKFVYAKCFYAKIFLRQNFLRQNFFTPKFFTPNFCPSFIKCFWWWR